MKIENLTWIRTIPMIGNRLYDAFKSIQQQTTNIETQTNSNAQTQPGPPPAVNGLHVSTGPGGEFQIAITDNGQIQRGINYWVEHSDNPQFSNPHHIDMGQSRNASVYMGSQALYWRAYSSYPSSPSSAAVYHGSQSQPMPVTGGQIGLRSQSQGAGTGAPGQGLQGPGPVPARTPFAGFDWKAQGPQRDSQSNGSQPPAVA